jgi:Pentapeptide repeats (8 copies)
MADQQQFAIARQGSDAWNAWRKRNESVDVDLSGAELPRAELIGAYLNGANLSEANLCGANLSGAYLFDANLSGANLRGAALGRASLIKTIFEGADLTGCRVYGISAWDLKLDGAKQKDLIITPYKEPEITVDNLEVAQFIYLLLHNERIRHVIDTITSKVVLILGRFTDERKAVLDALREELRQRDYTPVLFDFDKPASRTTIETVSTLAHMSRFMIADLTDAKSVLQELQAIVPTNPSVPVQPLILETQDEPGMFDFIRRFPWVLGPYRYPDPTALLAALADGVIVPAEAKLRDLRGLPSPIP